jgi:LemA protein
VKTALIAITALVVLALGAGSKYVSVRKELGEQRREMSEAWVQVDAVLEKRAAAVQGLVDGVKDAIHDQPQIQRDLEDASAALLKGRTPEEKIQANARLNAALAKLLLLSETTAGTASSTASGTPQAKSKSDRGFVRLESELADAETHIALARRKYNEALEHYNAQIQQFPENVVASISGFTRNDAYFKTVPGERPPIKTPF